MNTKRGVELKEDRRIKFESKKPGGNSMDVVLELHAVKEKPAEALISFTIEGLIPDDDDLKSLSLEEAEKLIKKLKEFVALGKKFEAEY